MGDFRKKTFRGAKLEDLILEVERLEKEFDRTYHSTQETDRKLFYEGMVVAFKIVVMKIKGEFEYHEDTQVNSADDVSVNQTVMDQNRCSFCLRNKEVVVRGPSVTICGECLDFGKQLLTTDTNHSVT